MDAYGIIAIESGYGSVRHETMAEVCIVGHGSPGSLCPG